MAGSVQVHNQRESVALDMRVYSHLSAEERVRIDELRTQPIGERPKRVGPRREFGHYESDTVIGASPSRRCIDTQVERRSRRLFARFIPDKSALATARAEYDIYSRIPAPARIDRTWDNGTESSCHLLVDRNGRIRRYLPKRTSFDDLTDADLQAIVDEINDTPMKVLDWETPNEV